MQLFLLHFAGGNCYSFDFLKPYLGGGVSAMPLELPGRGRRIREACLRDKQSAIQDYTRQVAEKRNGQPYVIYGHSMGATLGYSVTRAMEAMGDPPRLFVASGNAGPGAREYDDQGNPSPRKKYHLLEDAQFKEAVGALGGMPSEVLEEPELYDFFAPILRADFTMLEREELSEKGQTIKTGIFAMMGNEEKSMRDIDNWHGYTTGRFGRKVMAGNHFFIHDHPQALANVLTAALQGAPIA